MEKFKELSRISDLIGGSWEDWEIMHKETKRKSKKETAVTTKHNKR